tara:strand:- start:2338 stop:2736 length:399 start_codon:yes stop_codon:yes gene_type:complete
MKRVKTAKGQILDMAALASKYEKTRAVSNVDVNARGDIIDNRNQVKVPREKISKEFYKNNVPGADTKEVSIKTEEKKVKEEVKVEQPKAEPKKESKPTETKRTTRTREDGTSYHEVEYSDGSMETIEIKDGE